MGFWEESRVQPSSVGGSGTSGKCWSPHLKWFLPSPAALPRRSSPFVFFLKNLLNLLQYCFCFMIWFFSHKPYGILTPWPGIEPTPPCIGRWSLNHCSAREVPIHSILYKDPFLLTSCHGHHREKHVNGNVPKDESLLESSGEGTFINFLCSLYNLSFSILTAAWAWILPATAYELTWASSCHPWL